MKSAEQGNAKGASIVAGCYLQGKGTRKDMPLAVEWLQKAAKQGDAEAQYNLGSIYYYGVEGVPKDEKKAFPLFEKSANQDDPDAQYNLGLMYYLGAEGVPQDEKKAFSGLKNQQTKETEMLNIIWEHVIHWGKV